MDEQRVLALLTRFAFYNPWSQCQLLELTLKYDPTSQEEVIAVLNLLDPWLRSANAHVVLAVARLFLKFTQNHRDLHEAVIPRLKDPLTTIISGANAEITFVVLSHMHMLAQKRPDIFNDLQRKFYLKQSDPTYLKAIKIELLQAISGATYVSQLQELIEELGMYAHDKNPAIAHLAVNAMVRTIAPSSSASSHVSTSRPAPVLAKIAEQLVGELVSLLEINWTCACDAAMAGLKVVLRLHPTYAADALPKAILAMKNNEERPVTNAASAAIGEEAYVWLLGEFSANILETPYLLEAMVANWATTSPRVKIQLLESATRIFFMRAPEMKTTLLKLLDLATGDPTHPDVHDKALYISRLLSSSLPLAEQVFSQPSASVTSFAADLDPVIQDMLFEEFNTLSVIYRETATSFIKPYELTEPAEDLLSGVSSLPPQPSTPPPTSTTYPSHVMSNPGSYQSPALATAPVAVAPALPEPSLLLVDPTPAVPELKLGQLKTAQTMQSKIYETMWKNLPVIAQEIIDFVPRSQVPKDLENALKDFKIYTVASGLKNGAITLFSYAQLDAVPAPHVLVNISLVLATAKLTAVIKSENKNFATSFHSFFKRVLSGIE